MLHLLNLNRFTSSNIEAVLWWVLILESQVPISLLVPKTHANPGRMTEGTGGSLGAADTILSKHGKGVPSGLGGLPSETGLAVLGGHAVICGPESTQASGTGVGERAV